MILGFTGSQNGMSVHQTSNLKAFFKNNNVTKFHHGGCVGADTEAHYIALTFLDVKDIIVHPCNIGHKQNAFHGTTIICKVKKPLTRNHDIVDASTELVATPQGEEILRSGTWATIRYARKMSKLVTIILPHKET